MSQHTSPNGCHQDTAIDSPLTAAEREVAALRKDRDGWRELSDGWARKCDKLEAELAVLREENQRLTAENEEQSNESLCFDLQVAGAKKCGACRHCERERAESAEARVTALEAALKEIADPPNGDCQCDHGIDCCANTDFFCPTCIAAKALTGKEDAPNG